MIIIIVGSFLSLVVSSTDSTSACYSITLQGQSPSSEMLICLPQSLTQIAVFAADFATALVYGICAKLMDMWLKVYMH